MTPDNSSKETVCALLACVLLAGCEMPPAACPGFEDGHGVHLIGSDTVWIYDVIDFKPHVYRRDVGTVRVTCEQLRPL